MALRRALIRRCATSALFVSGAAVGSTDLAFAQARDLLDAPQLKSRMRVQWDTSRNGLVFAADDETTFRPVPAKGLFLSKAPIALTYPRINPLRVQAHFAPAEAPDRGREWIARPLRTILGMALFATPVTPMSSRDERELARAELAPNDTCRAQAVAMSDVQLLARALYGGGQPPGTVAQALDGWRRTIDAGYAAGKSGPDSINDAVDQIARFERDLGTGLQTAAAVIERIDGETAKAAPADACEAAARYVYEGLRLADPRGRLQQLVALRHAVADLRRTLFETYVAPVGSAWTGTDFKIASDIRPLPGASGIAVVRVARFDFGVDELSGALVSGEETGGATALRLRKLARFTPEFGIGTVISSLARPSYGTSRNGAGETIVAGIDEPRFSVHPAFLVNFVCLCNTGPFVAPMLQVGVTTSTDVFALLSGAGIRLFAAGRGDVAIGGGGMLGWVKDLKTLRENDLVGGTKDIEADIAARRRRGWYLVVQYKF